MSRNLARPKDNDDMYAKREKRTKNDPYMLLVFIVTRQVTNISISLTSIVNLVRTK